MTMGILHGPAYRGRLSVCIGALFLLAFTAVHAEVFPPEDVFSPVGVHFLPVESYADDDVDVIVTGAPGTNHVGPLMILLFYSM
jgi:hypothetical protein